MKLSTHSKTVKKGQNNSATLVRQDNIVTIYDNTDKGMNFNSEKKFETNSAAKRYMAETISL